MLRSLTPVIGGAIGLTTFVLGLGFFVVNPRNFEWLMVGDFRVHFLGWHLYARAPWGLPLGATPHLGYPIGTSVALTDSLPIFAIPFKALADLLPSPFQYIGLWLLCCAVLQGVFAALLMRLITPRTLLQILGTALIVMSPTFIQRFGHPALSAHWLFLAALWWSFRPRATPASWQFWRGWLALLAIAAATHPYVAMMMLVLLAASYAREVLVSLRILPRAAIQVLLILGVVALVQWQSGYFVVSGAGDLQAGGLGVFSMNLLAPIIANEHSVVLPPLTSAATSGQYEGSMYLGAGLLMLAVVAVVVLPASLRPLRGRILQSRHLPFAVAFVVLTVIALSPVITAGPYRLFEYDARWWGPLAVFRASGRMFWPVFYALCAGIIWSVARLPYRVALPLVALAVVLQGVDVSGWYRIHHDVRQHGWMTRLSSEFWSVVPRHYQRITLVPTNICGSTVSFDRLSGASVIAGDNGMSINAGEAARYDADTLADYCRDFEQQLRSGALSPVELYLVLPEWAARVKANAQMPVTCVSKEIVSACFVSETYRRWQDVYDVHDALLPPLADFLRAYHDLDDEYDRLRRPAVSVRASPEQRSAALRQYLTFRVTGCDPDEATRKVLGGLRGEAELRLCPGSPDAVAPIPPSNETLAFWRELDAAYEARGAAESPSHLDPEGEAVWLSEYARKRLEGLSDDAARDRVREAVRAVARR